MTHAPLSDGWARVVGLLVTAVAVSFGAPVWFDLLNKFVNFRAAGVKPQPGGTSGALEPFAPEPSDE